MQGMIPKVRSSRQHFTAGAVYDRAFFAGVVAGVGPLLFPRIQRGLEARDYSINSNIPPIVWRAVNAGVFRSRVPQSGGYAHEKGAGPSRFPQASAARYRRDRISAR